MAENYNLSQNFGFNVTKKSIDGNQVKSAVKNIDGTIGNLFDKMTNYVAKYEDVFNGEVEQEINMYTRQSMIVGMNLRAEDKTRHSFDTKI